MCIYFVSIPVHLISNGVLLLLSNDTHATLEAVTMVTKKLHRSNSGTSVLLTKLCQLALLIMVQAEASIQHGSTECLSMGFTSQLVCSSCSKLPDYDLNVIKDNCYKCCQPETDEAATKKYSSAVLEVCS